MCKDPWFKRKRYGWGWVPATREGWAVMFLYIAVNLLLFRAIDLGSHSGSDTLINFAPRFLLTTLGLYLICSFAGEKPKWQWGNKRKHEK